MRTSYARGSRTGIQMLTLTALNMNGPIYMNLNDIYDARYLRRSGTGYMIMLHAPFADWITMAGVALASGEIEVGAGRMLLIHNAAGLYIPDTRNYQANVIVAGLKADSSNTLRDSGILSLRGAYWDSVAGASKDRDAQIFHRMLSTTPTSELVFQIAGTSYLRVGDRGVKIDKVVFDPGSSVSINAGATYTLPTGTYYVNLGPNTVAEYFSDVDNAWFIVIPAGGKGIVISDGSNVRLRNTGTVAESSNVRRVL